MARQLVSCLEFKLQAGELGDPSEWLCWMLQLRLQPDEAIYMKIVVKKPGLEMESIVSELDLSYKQRYGDTYIPDAYERLILDAIRGDQQHFVRRPVTPPMTGGPHGHALLSHVLQCCCVEASTLSSSEGSYDFELVLRAVRWSWCTASKHVYVHTERNL